MVFFLVFIVRARVVGGVLVQVRLSTSKRTQHNTAHTAQTATTHLVVERLDLFQQLRRPQLDGARARNVERRQRRQDAGALV